MLGLQENFTLNPSNSLQREYVCSGRSLRSAESNNRNSPITPWQGDQFYSRVKRSIQQTTRAKSATTKSVKFKACENRAKNLYSKINTVQIELTPPCNEMAKRSITKWAQPIYSQLLSKESSVPVDRNQEKEKAFRFTTVSFSEPEPIHQRKLSTKSFQPRIKIQHLNTQISRKKVIETNAKFTDVDKRKSLMFFFEVRNHSIVNRQRMVMKLRNIEKGRASRALNHIN